MALTQKRIDKDGLESRVSSYNEANGCDNNIATFFDEMWYLDQACFALDDALEDAGLEEAPSVGYVSKKDKITKLQDDIVILSAFPNSFIKEFEKIDIKFKEDIEKKALQKLQAICIDDTSHSGAELLLSQERVNDLKYYINEMENKLEGKVLDISQEEAVREYNETEAEIFKVEEQIARIDEVLQYVTDANTREELIKQRGNLIEKRIELEETQSQRIYDYALSGIDISGLDISNNRIIIVSRKFKENTSEKVTSAIYNYLIKDIPGDTKEEKTIYALDNHLNDKGEFVPDEKEQGCARLGFVYTCMFGDSEEIDHSDYVKYTDSQKNQIIIHWLLYKDNGLKDNEMPLWWKKQNLAIPSEYSFSEFNVVNNIERYKKEYSDELTKYYMSSYGIIDMISGSVDRYADTIGYTGETVSAMWEQGKQNLYEGVVKEWLMVLYGGMYDYVKGNPSVRAAKYIFEENFEWGDNKSKIGVYDVYTNESTSVYESEYYAYLTKFNHINEYVNNWNLFTEKTDRARQLIEYFREDGKYNSGIISLSDDERNILESAFEKDLNNESPIASYKEINIVAKELEDKMREDALKKDLDVRVEGNKIKIKYKGGYGAYNGEEIRAYEYEIDIEESVDAFGGKYISKESYMKCIQDFIKMSYEKGWIEDGLKEHYKYVANNTILNTLGQEQYNELRLNISEEKFENMLEEQAKNEYCCDVFVDTFADVERNLDKAAKVKDTAKTALGIAALVLSIATPGSALATIAVISDGGLGILDGSIRIRQGETKEGVTEIIFSSMEFVGGIKQGIDLIETKGTVVKKPTTVTDDYNFIIQNKDFDDLENIYTRPITDEQLNNLKQYKSRKIVDPFENATELQKSHTWKHYLDIVHGKEKVKQVSGLGLYDYSVENNCEDFIVSEINKRSSRVIVKGESYELHLDNALKKYDLSRVEYNELTKIPQHKLNSETKEMLCNIRMELSKDVTNSSGTIIEGTPIAKAMGEEQFYKFFAEGKQAKLGGCVALQRDYESFMDCPNEIVYASGLNYEGNPYINGENGTINNFFIVEGEYMAEQPEIYVRFSATSEANHIPENVINRFNEKYPNYRFYPNKALKPEIAYKVDDVSQADTYLNSSWSQNAKKYVDELSRYSGIDKNSIIVENPKDFNTITNPDLGCGITLNQGSSNSLGIPEFYVKNGSANINNGKVYKVEKGIAKLIGVIKADGKLSLIK